MKAREYIDHLRELVESRRYAEAAAFAEREDEHLEGELTLKELGTLSLLMEHANLGRGARRTRPDQGDAGAAGFLQPGSDARGLRRQRL